MTMLLDPPNDGSLVARDLPVRIGGNQRRNRLNERKNKSIMCSMLLAFLTVSEVVSFAPTSRMPSPLYLPRKQSNRRRTAIHSGPSSPRKFFIPHWFSQATKKATSKTIPSPATPTESSEQNRQTADSTVINASTGSIKPDNRTQSTSTNNSTEPEPQPHLNSTTTSGNTSATNTNFTQSESSILNATKASKGCKPPAPQISLGGFNFASWYNPSSCVSAPLTVASVSPIVLASAPWIVPPNLQPNDTLTVEDLQIFLRSNNLVRQDDLASAITIAGTSQIIAPTSMDQPVDPLDPAIQAQRELAPKKTKSGVGLPQPSVLNYRDLQKGTTISGALVGMILGATVFPNLWLIGVLLGGFYGYEISNNLAEQQTPPNALARLLINSGRRSAKYTLELHDAWQTLWFLYKTGQLSYEYYKKYAVMDEKFAIQSKIDAWNARFMEGKVKFDAWEQENEIGRTVLAGLRTVWLVEEQSKRKTQKKSRYRAVQVVYDIAFWFGRLFAKVGKLVGPSGGWKEFTQGIRQDMKNSELDAIGTRVGAIVGSLIVVNMIGAVFAISPSFLALLAVLVGFVWPTWASELFERIRLLTEETRARGRGEDYFPTMPTLNTAKILGRYDKSRYHYYKRPDGSKKYYRTGQGWFGRSTTSPKKGSSPSEALSWPWRTETKKQKREPQKEQWGLFGRKPAKS